MEPLAIDHLGFLVSNLEESIERWSTVLGYSFSPVVRYRTEHYVDSSNRTPHFHDARLAVSLETGPMIELMEFTGSGTHAAGNGEGFHHFGFVGVPDVEGRIAEVAELGVGHDGATILESGRMHLCFTEPADLDGMRLEFVSQFAAPIVADDGSSIAPDRDGGLALFPEGATASAAPRVHHIGLLVENIEQARERWMAVTGWSFGAINHYRTDNYTDFSDPGLHHHDARTSMSENDGAKVELMEFTGSGTHGKALGEGFHHLAFIDFPSLAERREFYSREGVRVQGAALSGSGTDLLFFTDPADLDGVRLELVDLDAEHPIFTETGERVLLDRDSL